MTSQATVEMLLHDGFLAQHTSSKWLRWLSQVDLNTIFNKKYSPSYKRPKDRGKKE